MSYTGPAPSAPPIQATAPPALPTVMPRPYPAAQSALPREQQLKAVLGKYEISIASAQDLVALEGYEIVFVIDDSGSMQLPSEPYGKRRLGVPSRSRWDELCETVRLVAELACVFDPDGVDVYFLNRPDLKNVMSCDDATLTAALSIPPEGGTPLTETLRRVINDYSTSERPVLLLIATDGEPDGGPRPFINLAHQVITKQVTSRTFKFQVLACTDDDDSVAWLDKFDRDYKEVDVTDDYHTERAQVLKTGRTRFTRADWVIKALLGPILQKFDDMDETYVGTGSRVKSGMHNTDPCECIIL